MEISNKDLAMLQTMQSAETMLCYTKDALERLINFSDFPKLATVYNMIDDARDELFKKGTEIVKGAEQHD